MALGVMLVFIIGLFVVAFTCLTLLWIAKRERFYQVMVWICFLLGIFVSLVSVTSLPSNYIALKVVAYVIGSLSLAGLFCFFKRYVIPAKVFMSLSISLGILQLLFF